MVIAKNDPFIDFSTYKKAVLSDSIILNIQEHGGHMGYVNKSNTPLGTKRWQDYAVSEALKFLNKI